MVKNILVTTALEETWPKVGDNSHVVFLGEWCRLYSTKDQWSKMDAHVLPYHWDDRNKLYNDYKSLSELYERLLIDLSIKLNEIHGVKNDIRYWRILIGPWLGIFVQILFDRWFMIQRVFQTPDIFETIILAGLENKMIPNDMNDFVQMFQKDEWNHYIYGLILQAYPTIKIRITRSRLNTLEQIAKSTPSSLRQKLKQCVSTIYLTVSNLLTKATAPFFINTFLSKKNQIKLALSFNQLPVLPIIKKKFPISPIQSEKRQWYLGSEIGNEFEQFVRSIIVKQIPTVYLEGYSTLLKEIKNLSWPANPAIIFTSNSHWYEDTFKAYAAENVQRGTPLVLGQHGGHYGIGKWSFYEDHEIMICDRYLSWGWTAQEPKVKAIGKLTFDKPFIKNHNNKAPLLVIMTLPRYSYTMYSTSVASQWINYFEDQCTFIKALLEPIRDKLIVRIFKQDNGWDQLSRFKDRFPELNIDSAKYSIHAQIKKSKIYISTYNASTYLEALNLNMPTIIFWNPKHWELRDSAIPFYEDLKRVGIFHETPELAASHINSIWDDVDSWWDSEELQDVLKCFKKQFCDSPDNLVNKIEAELREVMNTNKSCL